MRAHRTNGRARPTVPGAGVSTVFAILAAALVGCSPAGEPARERPAGTGHEGHDHRSSEEPFDRGLLDRLEGRRCEHERPILECTECRYEVGAVDVSPALLSPTGDHLVRVAPVRLVSRPGRLQMSGEVSFDDERVARVSPRVEGLVQQVFARLGDRVSRGDKLVAMDSVELGRLRAERARASARLGLARATAERARRLHEKRIAPGRQREQAEADLGEAEVELDEAEEQLRLLGIGGAGAEGRSGGRIVLRSPVDGTVVSLRAVRGELISPEAEVTTIADLTRVWVWAHAYERDLAPLLSAARGAGLPAEVRAAAFPDRVFAGTVDLIGSVVERSTRTVKVRVAVSNDEELLRPGLFVEVDADLGERPPALLVASEAVMAHEGRSFVFVKVGPTRFLRRDVETSPAHAGLVELRSGVAPGEEVVVHGAFLLKSDVLRERMGAGCAD